MYEQRDAKDRLVLANGISEQQFFFWQCILRREAYEVSKNPSLPAVTETRQLSAVQQSVSFAEIKFPAVLPDASSVFWKVYIAAGYTDYPRRIIIREDFSSHS